MNPFQPPNADASAPLGTANHQSGPMPTPRTAFAPIAWIVIILLTGLMAAIHNIPMGPQSADNSVAESMMELQGKLVVGLADLQRQMDPNGTAPPPVTLDQLEPMNVGPVSQRDRFVILVAEVLGPEEADRQLERLEQTIASVEVSRPSLAPEIPVMTDDVERAHNIVRKLYAGAAANPDGHDIVERVDALPEDDRLFLRKKYGWFGKLALLPPDTPDTAARKTLLAGQATKALIVGGGVVAVCMFGLVGLVGLVFMVIRLCSGRLRTGIEPTAANTGVYAETFALWLILFFGLQLVLSVLLVAANLNVTGLMAVNVAAFFASLVVLAWPVRRGISWTQVRRDIGLTLGRNPIAEPVIGLAGYAMGLPLLAVGIILTLILMALSAAVGPSPIDDLMPAGGPAHPIAGEIAKGGLATKLMILLLASVAAPIVEETMFRGVLYRHLRASSRTLGLAGAVIMGTIVNSFIFAIVHPQGWFAVPALMSLSITFTLLREWRGTLVPSMVVHGTSNGLVMSMLFLLM